MEDSTNNTQHRPKTSDYADDDNIHSLNNNNQSASNPNLSTSSTSNVSPSKNIQPSQQSQQSSHHQDFHEGSDDEESGLKFFDAKNEKNDSEPLKNLGAQARMSSEARYTRFSEYVLKKISDQVLRCAKKGLWKTEIFLVESTWSRDPENQRRLLVSLEKQELSARVFQPHNKKVRILVWWSVDPPIVLPHPFLSSNDASEEEGNIHKRKAIKKKDIALDEDSSDASEVIETDFKQAKKYDKKIKYDEITRIKKAEKNLKKQEKAEKKAEKKFRKHQLKEQKRKEKHPNEAKDKEEEDSDKVYDFNFDLSESSGEDSKREITKKARKIQKKEKKLDKKREKLALERLHSKDGKSSHLDSEHKALSSSSLSAMKKRHEKKRSNDDNDEFTQSDNEVIVATDKHNKTKGL
jgi:hypothetical protein